MPPISEEPVSPSKRPHPRRSLGPAEIRLIVLTLGYARGREISLAPDSPLARRLGGPGGLAAVLRGEMPISDPRMRAVHQFARDVIRHGGRPTACALRNFLDAGFSRSDVLEVVRTVTSHSLSEGLEQGEASAPGDGTSLATGRAIHS